MNNKDIKDVLQLSLLSQSMIHKIDNISDSVIFKQEFKKRTNNFLSFLEKHINTLTNEMDSEEGQYYVDIVSKIDEIVEGIEVEII